MTDAKPAVEVAELPELCPMILTALDAVARDDGWAALGAVGSQMNKNNPSFDPRNVRPQPAVLELIQASPNSSKSACTAVTTGGNAFCVTFQTVPTFTVA